MLQPALLPEIPTRRLSSCRCCHRALSNPRSCAAGIGPVCARKNGGPEMRDQRPADQDVYDLPFDPATMDITCRRDVWVIDDGVDPPGQMVRLHYNISRQHVDHSPSGWEWGYGGSGPSDYALNILATFIGPAPEALPQPTPGDDEWISDEEWDAWVDHQEQRVELHDGTFVHADVYRLHHEFKFAFVASLPREGGTIPGAEIRRWIEEHRVESDAPEPEGVISGPGVGSSSD